MAEREASSSDEASASPKVTKAGTGFFTAMAERAFKAEASASRGVTKAPARRPEAKAYEPTFLDLFKESFAEARGPGQNILSAIYDRLLRGKQVDPAESARLGRTVFTSPTPTEAPDLTPAETLPQKAGQIGGIVARQILDPTSAIPITTVPRAIIGGLGIGALQPATQALAEDRPVDPKEVALGAGLGAAGGVAGAAVGKGFNLLRAKIGGIGESPPSGTEVPSARASKVQGEVPEAPRSAGAAEATGKGFFTRIQEAIGDKLEPAVEKARLGFREVSRPAAKSISYLDEPARFSPTLKTLRETIEHRDLPGSVSGGPDFGERVLLKVGEFNKRLEGVQARFTAAGRNLTASLRGEFKPDPLAGVAPEILRGSRILGLRRFEAKAKAGKANPTQALDDEARKLLDDIRTYAREGGLNIEHRHDYFPRIYDTDYLATANGQTQFIKVLIDNGIDAGDAHNIATNMALGDGIAGPFNAGRVTVGRISPETTRVLGGIPDKELRPFLINNPNEALPMYIRGMVKRTEYARTFGPNNETLDATMATIQKEMIAAGRPLRPEEQQRILDISQALAGDYGRISQKGLRRFNNLVVTYQYLRTLPLATLSSLTEPFIAIERGGLGNFVKAIPAGMQFMARQTLRTVYKGVPKAKIKEDLEEIGLGLDSTLREVLQDQLGTGTGKVQDIFFKLNLMSPFTRFTQALALKTGQNMIRKNALAVAAGKASKQQLRELQELGLNPQLAAEWTTNPGIYAGNIRAASLRFVNEVVMNPRGTVKPLWMSNEKLRLLSMLKGYWITAGNTILKRMAWRLTRGTLTDKARVLGAVGLMLPTAYLSDEIRAFIKYGSEGDPKRKTETTAEMYLRIMNRAGLTGILPRLPQGI